MASSPTERVVVCGAGAAGMAAAVGAARAGADVCLIEALPRVGGTVTNALIHTLGGLYGDAGDLLNDGLAAELARKLAAADPTVTQRRLGRAWVLSVCPETYRTVVQRLLATETRIRVLAAMRVIDVVHANGRVREVVAAGPEGQMRLSVRAVIDATGTAEVVRLVDPGLVRADGGRAAGGLIFRMRGVDGGALAFPRGLAVVRALRSAAAEGRLSPRCGKAWLDIGIAPDEAFVKLFVPLPEDWREREARGEIMAQARDDQTAVVAFLKRLPEFGAAYVTTTGTLGVRDGGRIHGEYCLTAEDVRCGRKFSDAAARCAWPIEYWDPETGVSMEYLPEGTHYEIPLRALRVAGFANLWAVGKCLSAEPRAHASARVVGACWAMGGAAGAAAAS